MFYADQLNLYILLAERVPILVTSTCIQEACLPLYVVYCNAHNLDIFVLIYRGNQLISKQRLIIEPSTKVRALVKYLTDLFLGMKGFDVRCAYLDTVADRSWPVFYFFFCLLLGSCLIRGCHFIQTWFPISPSPSHVIDKLLSRIS